MRSIVSEVFTSAFGSPSSTKRQGACVEHQKWRTVRPYGSDGLRPRDQINLGDYPYLVRGYPSNHVEVVGYLLGTGPNLLPYKYKGVRPIENPRTHPNRTYLLYLPFLS
jgi:hypothetical protein